MKQEFIFCIENLSNISFPALYLKIIPGNKIFRSWKHKTIWSNTYVPGYLYNSLQKTRPPNIHCKYLTFSYFMFQVCALFCVSWTLARIRGIVLWHPEKKNRRSQLCLLIAIDHKSVSKKHIFDGFTVWHTSLKKKGNCPFTGNKMSNIKPGIYNCK